MLCAPITTSDIGRLNGSNTDVAGCETAAAALRQASSAALIAAVCSMVDDCPGAYLARPRHDWLRAHTLQPASLRAFLFTWRSLA
jgi:hypothetical protein